MTPPASYTLLKRLDNKAYRTIGDVWRIQAPPSHEIVITEGDPATGMLRTRSGLRELPPLVLEAALLKPVRASNTPQRFRIVFGAWPKHPCQFNALVLEAKPLRGRTRLRLRIIGNVRCADSQ